MANLPYYMLCIWTFIHVGRPQDILTFLIPLHIGDITAALTIISYFFLTSSEPRPQVRSYPEVKLFLLLFLVATLCTPFSYYASKSVAFMVDIFLKLGIYLWLVAKLMTSVDRIKGIVKTLMFSGVTMALPATLRAGMGIRVGGGATYDPNDLGLVLVTTLPIAIMQGLSTPSLIWKGICFAGAAVDLVGVTATKSRGAFLGLAALAVFMVCVKLPGISKKKFILILTSLAILFGTYLGAEYKERIRTIFDETYSDVSAGSGRIGLWQQCLVMARDHPILGVGPDAFSPAFGYYLENDKFPEELSREVIGGKWQAPHNAFLQILVEMGLPGLLIFVSINIKSFRNFQRIKTASNMGDVANMLDVDATTLQMSLLAFLVCAFFLSQAYSSFIYLFYFLSGAMVRIASSKKPVEL